MTFTFVDAVIILVVLAIAYAIVRFAVNEEK